VKARGKKDALKKVEKFMEPFYEGREVTPYKEHLSEADIKRMAEHYEIPVDRLQVLAEKMEDWDGYVGGVDEQGLFKWSEYNELSEWDWYQFGGRWMWSDLVDKNIHNIVKPGTDHYWNRYHDKDAKAQFWLCMLPDGTWEWMELGSDYGLKSWVADHPELSEVKDASDPEFYKIIEQQLEARKESIKWCEEQVRKYDSGEEKGYDMSDYYRRNLEALHSRWTNDSYFWNITGDSLEYDREEIDNDPEHWFIVNVDLHI